MINKNFIKRNIFFQLLLFIFLFSCGGASYLKSPLSHQKGSSRISSNASMDKYKSDRKKITSEADEREVEKKPINQKKKRLIIYKASYSIIVESVGDAVNSIEDIVKKYKGFIESSITSDSYRYAKIIIKVPVKDFESTLKRVSNLGEITNREVSASDVTDEFRDVSLRIDTAKKVRGRLYKLLKVTKKVSERVKILREIERLSSKIESLLVRLTYLKNRSTYSTIILQLKAKIRQVVSGYLPSHFPWIASLSMNKRSIYKDEKSIEYEKPDGFYFQEKRYYDEKNNSYLFRTPGSIARIRHGVVKNYPPAKIKFWEEAFELEIKNRKYKVISRKKIKSREGVTFIKYVMNPIGSFKYIVAFAATEDYIVIIEGKHSSIKSNKKYIDSIDKFIKSVRIK
jgi:uncharacterized protein DUF4349